MIELEDKIGYSFKNKQLLINALTHSSYKNENNLEIDNERLEFLGDSLLGFISAEYLFKKFEKSQEGKLSRLRASEVCEKSLADFARQLELGKFIRLGKGELASGGADRSSILSNAFEAIIAAIYLDGGMEPAKKFVLRFVNIEGIKEDEFVDYKTLLQEVVQQTPGERLEYVNVAEYGPAHERTFEVEVHLNNNPISKGTGSSKKKSEQMAAKAALELMGIKI
jgi:ribonuclease-3